MKLLRALLIEQLHLCLYENYLFAALETSIKI